MLVIFEKKLNGSVEMLFGTNTIEKAETKIQELFDKYKEQNPYGSLMLVKDNNTYWINVENDRVYMTDDSCIGWFISYLETF